MQEFVDFYPRFVSTIAQDLSPELCRGAAALRDLIHRANDAAERAKGADAARKAAREAEEVARKAEEVASRAEAEVAELAGRIDQGETALREALEAWVQSVTDPDVKAKIDSRFARIAKRLPK
jgi:hypothetical protein